MTRQQTHTNFLRPLSLKRTVIYMFFPLFSVSEKEIQNWLLQICNAASCWSLHVIHQFYNITALDMCRYVEHHCFVRLMSVFELRCVHCDLTYSNTAEVRSNKTHSRFHCHFQLPTASAFVILMWRVRLEQIYLELVFKFNRL